MMRAICQAIVTVVATMVLFASQARADEPATDLQRNPFDRPEADVLTSNVAPASGRSTSEGNLFLRAVLVAGENSVVNFGGIILQIGETANGYRLLSVEEGEAIFSKGGEKVAFSLYKQEQAEDQ